MTPEAAAHAAAASEHVRLLRDGHNVDVRDLYSRAFLAGVQWQQQQIAQLARYRVNEIDDMLELVPPGEEAPADLVAPFTLKPTP